MYRKGEAQAGGHERLGAILKFLDAILARRIRHFALRQLMFALLFRVKWP